MRTFRLVTTLVLAATLSVSAVAAKTKPAAKAAAKPAATESTLTPEQQAAEKSSALFYSICADSMGNQDEFDKRMKSLEAAKTFVKMKPEELKDMVSAEEAKDAWGTKGFGDANKTLLVAYNASQNICGMHVSDVPPNQLRHAYQADLKKLLDRSQGTVKVYKPQTNGTVNIYAADIAANGKTMNLGLAISKNGESFLTFHM